MAIPDFSVAGQHVLISGGCGGIGSAFARAFLAHGAMVTVTDLKPPPPELTAAGALFETLDVTSDDAVNALAAKIPRLNVLIHCAGRLIRWEEHKPEVFRDIVDIHLFGNVRLAAAFRPHLKATRGCMITRATPPTRAARMRTARRPPHRRLTATNFVSSPSLLTARPSARRPLCSRPSRRSASPPFFPMRRFAHPGLLPSTSRPAADLRWPESAVS